MPRSQVRQLDFDATISIPGEKRRSFQPKVAKLDLLIPTAIARVLQMECSDDPPEDACRADQWVYLAYGLMLVMDGFRAAGASWKKRAGPPKRVALVHFGVTGTIVGTLSGAGFTLDKKLTSKLDDLYEPF